MAAFSYKDHTVKLVRSNPDGSITEKRLFSGNKLSFDPGPKASIMKGFDLRPFGIIYGSAEPKFSADGMSAAEVQDSVEFLGGIGGPQFSIVCVVQRPGQQSRILKCTLAAIGEGGNWDADEGSGATGKLGGPFTDLLYAVGSNQLKSIFAPRTR